MEALVREAVAAADREQRTGFCFGCGERFDRLDECSLCGELVTGEAGMLCASCWDYKISRD
ncbi:hypothetical protein [Sphaerisporangium aureirubrum]|uniref:Double zinc ribbon domain-containing protein n=1 Tax=Sphaerisporangium aureirubrum TaxID=1544736 RepID=A0ABW1NBW8_9ACTN